VSVAQLPERPPPRSASNGPQHARPRKRRVSTRLDSEFATDVPSKDSRLYRWGLLMGRHAWPVIAVWLALVIAGGIAFSRLESGLATPDFSVAGSDSAVAAATISQEFPSLGAEQDAIVFTSRQLPTTAADYRATVQKILQQVGQADGVTSVVSPYDPLAGGRLAGNGQDALGLINLRGDPAQRTQTATHLQTVVERAAGGSGVEALLTGPSPLNAGMVTTQLHDQKLAESIGIPAAFIALLIALGAVVAALLPVVLAVGAVLLGTLLMALMENALDLDQFALVVATMVGLGIGIDYALFIVARFREELQKSATANPASGFRSRYREAERDRVALAVAVAVDTSGRTIISAGFIVAMAMGSIFIVRGHVFTEFAICAVIAAACAVLGGLTLLPAALTLLGDRVNAGQPWSRRTTRSRRTAPGATVAGGNWARWARMVLRHPLLFGGPALLVLLLAALPLSSMRLGLDLGLDSLNGTRAGQGANLVASSFGQGLVAPVNVVACRPQGPFSNSDLAGLSRLETAARADPRVVQVIGLPDLLAAQYGALEYRTRPAATLASARGAPPLRSALERLISTPGTKTCAMVYVILDDKVDSPHAAALVTDLRQTIAPRSLTDTSLAVHVGGLTAQYTDLSREASRKLPLVMGFVLVLSFFYLLFVFRSILLPLKAVLLNLLATAASLGVAVLVFQDGYGQGLLGFTSAGTLQAFLPVALFALLFGLSMDYEVFLVRRMQEEWIRTGDNDQAITEAVARTGRPITAAAAIMACVFGSFLVADVLELKQMGFVLAFAILLDATVVRLLLVPSLMGLAGPANWWLPSFLSSRLRRAPAH
jgi:RND superfamily putative drug exporter